jgi:hypothetical protein
VPKSRKGRREMGSDKRNVIRTCGMLCRCDSPQLEVAGTRWTRSFAVAYAMHSITYISPLQAMTYV